MLDLVAKRNWFYLFSAILVIPGVISLMIPPRLKPGIEFTGGTTFSFTYAPADVFTVGLPSQVALDKLQSTLTDDGYGLVQVQSGSNNQATVTVSSVKSDGTAVTEDGFKADLEKAATDAGASAGAASVAGLTVDTPTSSEVHKLISDLGHSEARVQTTGTDKFLVTTKEIEGSATTPPVGPALPSERENIESALGKQYGGFVDTQGKPTVQFTEFSSVSAAVSRQIGRNAAIAVIVASIAITLYITWSFRNIANSMRYGISAIVALLHDVLLVVGVFSILGKFFNVEVDTFFITGLLTVVGFSVHDSIVVFDRVRENVARGLIRNFPDAVNHSLLQTAGRSFNTSLTLIFSILALLLLGGGSIRDFLLVLLVGVSTGAYSSIFIASMFLVTWQQGDIPRAWRRIAGRRGAAQPAEAAPAE